MERQLTDRYPSIEFLWNNRTVLDGLELDVYIPSLSIAFELNGIFHYEDVFGSDRLEHTQNKDRTKYQRCIEKKISLCVIDTTSMKYFKEAKATEFLDVVVGIIDERLAEANRVELLRV